jgi:hypothetical protein
MKRALSIYQYAAPLILTPCSFFLWQRTYGGNLKLTLTALIVPVLWAYIVPGIGTNVLGVWELDTRLRLGRFRPHHGFVFGSATAMLAWLAHTAPASSLTDVLRNALVMGSLLGFWNILYDVKALQAGVLRVYNQPWAEGRGAAEIVLDYGPWFFGGFGAIYGAGMAVMELLDQRGTLTTPVFILALSLVVSVALVVPAAGYVGQSILRHGHWGTRPVMKKCPNA